jgi:uncharacterized protein (TIGR02099 family)
VAFSSDDASTLNGDVFFSATNAELDLWQALLPQDVPYVIEKGHLDVKVWTHLDKGHVSNVQSTLLLRDCWWRKQRETMHQMVRHLTANLAWKKTSTGWQWSADHIDLQTPQKQWPENEFLLTYKKSDDSYRLFVQTLVLEPLLGTLLDWPDALAPIFKMQLQGHFDNSQFGFQNGKINYFLSRFSQLSWAGTDTRPTVKNLSGALYWEPNQGRLELDGENTVVVVKKKAPLQFKTINMAVDWTLLNQGWRVNLDRLMLEHEHLLLSARGLLDGWSPQSNGTLQLLADFSAKDAHTWLFYLPERYLKPKLYTWLKEDVTRIADATGRIQINGKLDDFPFDERPGEFSVVSSLTGLDLFFNRQWPKVKDISALLRVDKRELSADVSDANLYSNVITNDVSLHVSELGLGQETLLVHGQIQAPANKMLGYVFVSPLRQRLGKLKALSVKDKLDIELGLAVPLYPENNNILVRGAIDFNQNDAILQIGKSQLPLHQVEGTLLFNEHGVVDSTLHASLLGDPLTLRIASHQTPKPATHIDIAGEFSIAAWREQWKLPLLALMQGHATLNGLITLVDDPKVWDSIKMTSSLQGIAITLPPPFNKLREDNAPLDVNVDFNVDKGARLRVTSDKLKTDLWFTAQPSAFLLNKGWVCIGSAPSPTAQGSGAKVFGVLDNFDATQWQTALATLPDTSSLTDGGLDGFHAIDLTFKTASLLGQHYQNLHMQATQLPQHAWSITMRSGDIIANLQYQPVMNLLSGNLSQLVLKSSSQHVNKQPSKTQDHLKPENIPNLALTIDALMLDHKKLGQLILKSSSRPGVWHLDDGSLTSKGYVLKMTGDWQQRGAYDQTTMDAALTINDLSTILTTWEVPPVVEAENGTAHFVGGWVGKPHDFSLKSLEGQLDLMLQDGRITHFDPETEEKLGLGKLLSILSLQTIPRRLKLDFSDLAKTGYSFDQFSGHFSVKDGAMSTNDSSIDGPVAYASMKGQLDLVKRLYDLDLRVSPHVTASLPVVVTLAGGPIAGPIAGIATWAASKMLHREVDKVTGYTYTITGPWLEPVVQQVHIYRKAKKIVPVPDHDEN